jgi:hypothetical protein
LDRFIPEGCLPEEASPAAFAVWLGYDIPMCTLDYKVMDSFEDMYLEGERPEEAQWLKQAEKLMEDKTHMTLYDVYEALWNNYGTVSTLFRKDKVWGGR